MNFEIVTEGDIEQCRALCNELMQHQYKMSVQQRHIFAGMNFDTRLKPSFENASEKMLVIAKDEGSWICPYISRHLLSLNPLLACCRRYSRGER